LEQNEVLTEIKYNEEMFISYKRKYEEASKYIRALQEGGENISKINKKLILFLN
jgi:hypothetical protein